MIPQMKILYTDKVSKIAQIKGTVRPGYLNPDELPYLNWKTWQKTIKYYNFF